MEFYLVLTVSSAIIAALAFCLWLRTREISLLVGIGLLYFWTIYGAWSIVTDKLGGQSGMHYEYLEEKMFSVSLDKNYLWSLILYAAFIVMVELVLLLALQLNSAHNRRRLAPVRISHLTILIVGGTAGLASFFLVKGALETAAELNLSAYLGTRGAESGIAYFTIHQILNRIALIPTVLGFVVSCSGRNPRLLSGQTSKWTGFGYLLILGGMVCFCFTIGNKNDLLVTALAGCLFYMANAEHPRVLLLAAVGISGLMVLGVLDLLRGVPLPELATALASLRRSEFIDAARFLASSNEAFAAHSSLYGALAHNLSPTYGSSLISLAASIVPRVFWPGRPDDIYVYYAQGVSAAPGQGYTIHHATGWYLNFGALGVVVGGAILGWVWAKCYNRYASIRVSRPSWDYAFRILAPFMVVAYMPPLIRNGIEGYKGLIVEGLLIPPLVVTLAFARKRLLVPGSMPSVRSHPKANQSFADG